MSKEKPKRTFYTWLGVIGDYVMFPIILLSILISLMIFVDRRQTEMPSVLGFSLVRIISGSMEDSGFLKGEQVIIKKTDNSKLWIGDIIAFYNFYDEVDKTLAKTIVNEKDEPIMANLLFEPPQRTTLKEVKEKKLRVYFHEIVKVKYDAGGTKFYVTKGSSNASVDSEYGIREDLVVGKYVNTSKVARSVFNFVTSPMGMIVLVCLPLGILVILEALSLIEQINFIYIEKQLLLKKADWKDKEVQRFLKSGEMEEIAKIIYYGKYDGDDKKELQDMLWHLNGNKNSLKQIEWDRKLNFSFNILSNNKDAYWLFWENNIKTKFDKKMLDKYVFNNQIINLTQHKVND